jgi:hypothetical protein
VGGGSISVSIVTLESKAATNTQAFVDDGAQVTAGTVDIQAHADNTVTATSFNLSIGLAAGALTSLKATDDSQVNSRVGPGTGNDTAGTPASITASNNVTVGSLLESQVNADAITASLSILVSVGLIKAEAINTADVRSYLGDAAQITASGGHDVSFTATSHSKVFAEGFGIAGSATVGVAGLLVQADMKPSISAFSESGGSINARHVSFTANNNENLTSGNADCSAGQTDYAACSDATGGAAAPLAGFNDTDSKATDSPTIFTGIGAGTQITATGNLNVVTNSKQKAKADVFGLSISLGASVGLTHSTAVAEGSTQTFLGGIVLQAAAITVRSNVDFTARAHGQNISGSLLVAGAISDATARIGKTPPSDPATVATYVTGTANVTATGDINVFSVVTTNAYAENQAISASLLVGINSTNSSATVQPTIRTYADTGSVVASQSGNVSFLAAHNFNPEGSAYLSNNKAEATAGNFTISFVSLDIGSDIDAAAKADVDASIKSGATLRAGNTVNVTARSSNVANARFETTNIGGISITAGANPTTTVVGKTAARLLGNVIAVDNVSAGAASVNVLSDARDFANSRIQSVQAGAVTVGDSESTSHSNPQVSVELGNVPKSTTSGISAKATSNYDSDATSTAVAGGAITISILDATADSIPQATLTVNDGSSFTAGGLIELLVTQNKVETQLSDGSFDAGDECPLNVSSPGCVDRSNGTDGNSFTVNLPHGLATGDVVTYDARGQTVVGGLTNGRSYGVIVLDSDTLQLGAQFQGGAVDPANDTIRFSAPHNFVTGDLVRYFGSTIGGLTSGNQYSVYVVDDPAQCSGSTSCIKLRDPSYNPDTEVVNGSSISATTVTTSNNFVNGQPVTYQAPAATAEVTSMLVDAEIANLGNGQLAQQDIGNGDQVIKTQNNDTIYIAYDRDEDGDVDPHVVSTGNAIVYTASDTTVIGGLNTGVTYYASDVNNWQIRLAQAYTLGGPAPAYCFATGTSGHPECFAPDNTFGSDADSDPDPIPQTYLPLTPDKSTSGKSVLHTLQRAQDLPMALTDGATYFTCSVGAGSFQLQTDPACGGSAITINDNIAVKTGGPHIFRYEGVNITSAGSARRNSLLTCNRAVPASSSLWVAVSTILSARLPATVPSRPPPQAAAAQPSTFHPTAPLPR